MTATAATLNWEQQDANTKLGETAYTPEERASLMKLYDEKMIDVNEYEVVIGTIVGISNRDVIVNIGAKSDGLIPLNEFRDLPDLKPGDQVEVYVEEQENSKDQLVLSRKKAKVVRGWEKIQAAADNNEVIEGLVKRRTKGGLIVDIFGIESFLPGSQIDVNPVKDFDAYVGKTIDVAVVKINHANENVVVSHKVLIEKSLEDQKVAIIGNLEKGQILEGIVKNIARFGVFVDLGGIDGLIYIKDICWGKIDDPKDVLEIGQKVRVVVTDFDTEKKRISLGMKQLEPHPWDTLSEDIQVGSIVKGKVVRLADFGAFVEVIPGIEALAHISEMTWSQYPGDIKDYVQEGDTIEAEVLILDREAKKMTLGTRQLTGNPWESPDLLEKYGLGTRQEGIVRKLVKFGAFVELEEGIEGLLRLPNMSWTKTFSHPSELLKEGERIETLVIEIEREGHRLGLGLKQLTPNPWETHEAIFQIGTKHPGTVSQKLEKGFLVAMDGGLEGYVPRRHSTKANGQPIEIGEKLDFCILNFSREETKLLLSHTATYDKDVFIEGKDKKKPESNSTPKNLISKDESTLGDIEALADLKEKISQQEKEDAQAKEAQEKASTQKEDAQEKEAQEEKAHKQD